MGGGSNLPILLSLGCTLMWHNFRNNFTCIYCYNLNNFYNELSVCLSWFLFRNTAFTQDFFQQKNSLCQVANKQLYQFFLLNKLTKFLFRYTEFISGYSVEKKSPVFCYNVVWNVVRFLNFHIVCSKQKFGI